MNSTFETTELFITRVKKMKVEFIDWQENEPAGCTVDPDLASEDQRPPPEAQKISEDHYNNR